MLLAFRNKLEVKEFYLNRVREHRLQDEVVQGMYWSGTKGCAVGCTLHSSDHFAYETRLGVPELLAYLQDAIFETLSLEDAKEFPEKFLEAISVGADLSQIWSQFALWLLVDPECGVIREMQQASEEERITLAVAELIKKGGTVEEFRAAAKVADKVQLSAFLTYHVAKAFEESYDVMSNEWKSVCDVVEWADLKHEKLNAKTQAEKLIQLLKEAPIPANV